MIENPEVAARIALSIRRDGPDIVVWTTLTAEEWKWLVRREDTSPTCCVDYSTPYVQLICGCRQHYDGTPWTLCQEHSLHTARRTDAPSPGMMSGYPSVTDEP